MASSTIEWTEVTWNPITGCDRISEGCDRCYALTLAKRLKAMGQPKYQRDGDPRTSGPGFGLTMHPGALSDPLAWKRPRRVFVNSMSDLFHPEVTATFIDEVIEVMRATPQHTYQVLTKRPRRMAHHFTTRAIAPLDNLWLGTSIESERFTWRADHLRSVPAIVRFLSLEPLLGPLPSLELDGIDWVIVGGESGHDARPMELEWVRDLQARCERAGVAFFVKQLGTAWATSNTSTRSHGGDWSHWPADLRVRDYPITLAVSAP